MMHPNPRARTARAGIAAALATLLVALACETPTPTAVEIDHELGTITTLSSVYGEADVDKRPERMSGPLPQYPAMLRQAGIEGNVMVEFVITPEGKVDSSSVNVVESTNRAFEAPARNVILGSLYSSGELDGARVSTLVSQQVGFRLAGESARRVALTETRDRLIQTKLSESTQPLVVVDGVIVDSGGEFITNLNPNDIVRIEVIKGDAAEELWGAKGANGVITIFTKHSTQDVRRTRSN